MTCDAFGCWEGLAMQLLVWLLPVFFCCCLQPARSPCPDEKAYTGLLAAVMWWLFYLNVNHRMDRSKAAHLCGFAQDPNPGLPPLWTGRLGDAAACVVASRFLLLLSAACTIAMPRRKGLHWFAGSSDVISLMIFMGQVSELTLNGYIKAKANHETTSLHGRSFHGVQ